MNKYKLLQILIFLLGVSMFVLSFIFDPFSIPFQDFDQLPEAQQLAYQNKSDWMAIMRYIGFTIAFFSIYRALKARQKSK